MALGNLALGALHFITGLLLWLSDRTLVAPSPHAIPWLVALVAMLPWGAALPFYLSLRTALPDHGRFSLRLALGLRILGTATLALGLSVLYGWLALVLNVALGFWQLLSPLAQGALLGLLAAASLGGGGYLTYSQLIGHARAFLSETQVEPPTLTWQALSLTVGGYLMLLAPWLLTRLWPEALCLPRLNLLAGLVLVVIGVVLYGEDA
jgi:hypothetical protein